MAGAFQQAFQDEPIVAERGDRFAPGGGQRLGQPAGLTHRAHPLAAAAGRRLDHEREADLACRPGQERGRFVRGRRSRAGPGCRARRPAAVLPPCRPSPGSRRGEARPSGSRRPRPPRRTPAFSARNPKPGWRASAPVASAAATTAAGSSRSRPCGPSVTGMTARIPSRSQVRVIRRAISPRLAMKTVRIGSGSSAASSVFRRVAANASIASDATRHRPPTRRAGRRPFAIQRWTDRGDVPRRSATSRGLSSSGIGVVSVALVPMKRQRSRRIRRRGRP